VETVIELVINSTISNQWLSGNGMLQNLAEPCNARTHDGSCSVLKHVSVYLFMLAHVMLAAHHSHAAHLSLDDGCRTKQV